MVVGCMLGGRTLLLMVIGMKKSTSSNLFTSERISLDLTDAHFICSSTVKSFLEISSFG